ncbi:hypothetical protein OAT16_02595 [Prolixibacteraceae bacterium]|nr:hypothetical protein [Prolixibacteraceae bacterium]
MHNTLIICAHNEKHGYLREIHKTVSTSLTSNGPKVMAINLYKEHFDPIRTELEDHSFKVGIEPPIDIQHHTNQLKDANQILHSNHKCNTTFITKESFCYRLRGTKKKDYSS